MTSKPLKNLLFLTMIWSITSIAGCSTFIPAPTPTAIAAETAMPTKTAVPSATITSTPKPSPTAYKGPDILFYIQNDNQLFSLHADGSNQHEITQGIAFSVSPDKQKVVFRTAETYGSDTDEMVVLDLEEEEIILRWRIPGYCEGFFMSSYFAWSPDSQKIAFTLTRHDLVDPSPYCKLEYDYHDMGIYQIDLTTGKTTHPPLMDSFLNDLLHANVSYSSDGSTLRLDPNHRGYSRMFNTNTWEPIGRIPFYPVLPLCDQPEKIGICSGSNLCLYDQNKQISKQLTKYDKSWEGVERFKLFPNCSAVVYQTQDHQLHLLSLSTKTDAMIGTDVWEYFVTPDNSKIVYYQRDRYGKEANVFVLKNDGLNRHSIAKFPPGNPAIYGLPMVLSPIGEKVAFVNHDGIAIIDLDGNNFVQLVNLSDDALTDRISIKILGWY